MSARIDHSSSFVPEPPIQWLVANRLGGNERPQIIPNDSWTTVSFALGVVDSTIGRPAEGSNSENILTSVTLTTAGAQVIEVQAGGVATLALRDDSVNFLVIENTSANTSQVVRFTGTSAGTGSGGNDEITGVTGGSWAITGGSTWNIRQAAHLLVDPEDTFGALGSRYYLSCMEASIAFVGNATGVRAVRQVTWFDLFGYQQYPAFVGTTQPGTLGIDSVQVVNDYFQPGIADTATEDYITLQVYQSSGGDLALAANGPLAALPGYSCVFQSFLTARQIS
jgi:hypothetical protein